MTIPTSRAAATAPGFATDTFTHGAPNSRITIPPMAVANASTIWYCASPTNSTSRLALRGDARVGADLEIDADHLLDAPLPLPKTDDRFDLELAEEDLVHCRPYI